VHLSFRASLRDAEYQLLMSKAPVWLKARSVVSSGVRTVQRDVPEGSVGLVHRLAAVTPLPGFDPPRTLDVYDFDDALYLGSISSANRMFRGLKREAARFASYARSARVVVAGNSLLASHARQWARSVEVVPSCVDPSRQPMREHGESAPITIGWIGSPSTTPYLRRLWPSVEALRRSGVDARVVTVGAASLPGEPWLEQRAWNLEREADDLASFDLGVMPLDDDEWARGKCGYKLLQYFAAGLPVVASPVGINSKLVGDERGHLAQSQTEWTNALSDLSRDTAARREAGRAAREYVERNFSYERWAPELANLLKALGTGTP
jgi:glycosyltransferase involved in cell wall biosynthesis